MQKPSLHDSVDSHSNVGLGVIDLFSGAGGLSLGFKKAGFEPVCAVEIDKFAAQTYSKNFPTTRVLNRDIGSVKPDELLGICTEKDIRTTVVIGGPPCQPYSLANKQNNGTNHPKASSVSHYGRLVKKIKPSAFLFENVSSFRRLDGWERFLATFKKSGYSISVAVLRSSNFGVPQDRHRLFVTGLLNGSAFDLSRAGSSDILPTVRDAIWGLPALSASVRNENGTARHTRKFSSQYARRLKGRSKMLYNHWCTNHSPAVIETIRCIKQGKSLLSMWSEIPKSARSRFNNAAALHRNIYWRLSWDKIAQTVVNPRRAMIIHPSEHRIISVREAARLQSFPDSFVFCGGVNAEYQQVADAVPPLMAEVLAKSIRKVLVNKRSS